MKPANSTTVACPPVSSALTTFFVVNILASIFTVAIGHRLVTKKLTCGICGKRGSEWWRILWIVPLGLQLAANATIAVMVKRTPGYRDEFTVAELTLFFTARPRLSWIIIAFVSVVHRRKALQKDKEEPSTVATGVSSTAERPVYGYDYYWRSTALSQFIAEIILQLIATYTMVRTANFARKHDYYIIGNLTGALGRDAHMMYAGALLFLCM
ncbi:hypothetical protein GQ44DRAFT_775482 [Phaeosphaeriaceae sp. PMI808]|nr:hypothetical protein GQ44DRAFT_775482 [Phaeosphaeriaceae sp. PMI808]